MTPVFISLAAFVGVAALVGGVALLLRSPSENKVEDRLQQIMSFSSGGGKDAGAKSTLLAQPLDSQRDVFADMVAKFGKLSLLFEQADTNLSPAKFCAMSGVMAVAGFGFAMVCGLSLAIVPLFALFAGTFPLLWLILRRKRRLKKFGAQLPDALELVARALRAGHSLASGFRLVTEEMAEPVSKEFGRVFEEQNLGIPMNEALEHMTERVPNLDLKFFVTAVILQRQTGGDLAEILDKIGNLIRERFKIWGQVQALTGEGRLSGIVLLALPPGLFAAVYRLNPDYCMVLFTDPIGKKMLIFGLVLQFVGALVIRKIVNIRV